MPVDPYNRTVIFLRALHNRAPTDDQLAALDPDWHELVQAAINATPVNRRAAVILIKSGQHDTDRLLGLLRGNPAPQDRPWPTPTPFGEPSLPRFPEEVLPTWLTIYIRSEARATQVPTDLVAMLALAVLSTALAGPIVLNPWGDWLEPLNLFTMVVLPPGHRKSAIFGNVTAPLHQFETDAARNAAPLLALARRRQHAAEYLIEHARAAYAAMGLDPTVANVPTLLAWIKRTGRDSFSRRDARHAVRSRIRSDADLDDALADLEHHGYIRTQPARRAFGRPRSPIYDVHPSLVRR